MSCEEQHDAQGGAPVPGAADTSRYLPGSNSPIHSFSRRETCQIPGCAADLTSERKRYCWYKRICVKHLRAESLRVATSEGEELQRFCFQCGKLQTLHDFDGSKRSCREKLSQRRARQGAAALKAAACADSTAHGGPAAPATGTICAGSITSNSSPVISSPEQQVLPASSSFSLSCMRLQHGSGGGGGMVGPVLGVPAMTSMLSSPCAEPGSPAWAQPPVSTLPHALPEAARGAAAVLAAVPGPVPFLSGVQVPGGPLTLLPPSLPRLRLSPLQQQDEQLLRSPAAAATAAIGSTSVGFASAFCGQAAPQPAAVCSATPQARPSDSAAVLYGVSASLAADIAFPPTPASLALAAHDPLLPSAAASLAALQLPSAAASLAAINTAGTSASLAAADKAAGIASLAASSPMSAGEFENMLVDLLVEELTTMPCSPKTAASLDWLCARVLGPAAVPGVYCSRMASSVCGETEPPAAVGAATGHPLAGAGAGAGAAAAAAPYVSSRVGFLSPSALPISPGLGCPVSGLQQLQLSSLAARTQGSFIMGGPPGPEKHSGADPAPAAGAGVAAPYVSRMLVADGVSVQLSEPSAAGVQGGALHPGAAAAVVSVGPGMLQHSTAPGMTRPSHAHLQQFQALLAQLDSVEENLWRLKQYMSAVAAAGAASPGRQASSAVAADTAMYLNT